MKSIAKKNDAAFEALKKKLIPLCFYDDFWEVEFLILFNATSDDMQAFLTPRYGKDVVLDHSLWFRPRQAALCQRVIKNNVASIVVAFDKNSSTNRNAIVHESVHAAQFVLEQYFLWGDPEVSALYISCIYGRIVWHLKKNGKKLKD